MSDAFARQVASELSFAGLNAVTWDSGGGNVGVGICPGDVPPDEVRFFFGTADSTWAGEVLDDEGNTIAGLATTVSSEASEPRAVAAGIIRALADYVMTRP